MIVLFGIATFVGAFLTFLLELLVAQMILPFFGGTPSVWNTCVLFFQATLLAGYGYSHLLGAGAGWRKRVILHVVLMGIPLAVLPIRIGADWAPPAGVVPVFWQTWMLLATVGLPFFAVSATTPLVQRWLSRTPHPSGRDPYHLYAASNLGSLLALLAYPLVIEPAFDLSEVSRLWTAGYVVLLVLIGACGASAMLGRREEHKPAREQGGEAATTAGTRWRWLALAFVPSSLMLSVTTHLSTDVASAPLLWVLPLALYLLTYVLAFARRRLFRVAALERSVPLVVLLLAIVLVTEGLEPPPWLLFPLHLGALFSISLACHGQMADLRPPVSRLTEYYFWMALGGLAGGVFNAVIAPALFNGIVEYPVVLVLACLLRRPPHGAGNALPSSIPEFLRRDAAPAAALGLAVLGLVYVAPGVGLGPGPGALGLTVGVPVVACYLMLRRPMRFALALGALFLAGSWGMSSQHNVLFAIRTYYGVHRVRGDSKSMRLYHGPTLHGIQSTDPASRGEPLAYYHRSGPVGSLFRVLEALNRSPTRVAVLGAGVASLAAYGRVGQEWTFYEIDPTVIRLAKDSRYFTFWKDSAARLRDVLGDARLSLARETGERYDLVVLDAFSSDAVPVHLLTREAFRLYRAKLADHGVIAVHISNRFLDLEQVVGGVASDAGLKGTSWADLVLSAAHRDAGKFPSHWVVLSDDPQLIAALRASGGWGPLGTPGRQVLWTDGFSNLIRVFRWSG